MTLSHVQKAFVVEYMANGFNATRAYLKIRPQVTYETACANGCELLKNTNVTQAVQESIDRLAIKNIASREFLIQEAHDTGQLALQARQYKTKLQSVDLKARLNKLYDRADVDGAGYTALMQSITINVNQETANKTSASPDFIEASCDD